MIALAVNPTPHSTFVQQRIDDTPYGVAMHRYAADINDDALAAVGAATPVGTTSTYDALARHVLETSLGETRQLVYGCVSHWEVLEQIDLSQSPERVLTTHVYGFGIDDEVGYRIEDMATPEDMWSHRDDLNSLTSITDENGDVKERIDYTPYGVAMHRYAADINDNGMLDSSASTHHLHAAHGEDKGPLRHAARGTLSRVPGRPYP